MRVRRSAIGSDMLMIFTFTLYYRTLLPTTATLPTCFRQTRYIAFHRVFSQFVSAETKLAIHTMRPAGNLAALALTSRARVTGKLLQLDLRFPLLFSRSGGAQYRGFESSTLGSKLLGNTLTATVSLNHGCLCHA